MTAESERLKWMPCKPGFLVMQAFKDSVCLSSLLKITSCTEGASATCCAAVEQWGSGGCFCSSVGEVLLDTLPRVVGPAVLAVARRCKSLTQIVCSHSG